ncbi:MAG: DUF2061 domain-containing protein [Candidatus Aenigmatarchaeota archaeon]
MKTGAYRIVTFLIATCVTYLYTGRLVGSVSVVLTIEVASSVWYYSLDRVWQKVKIFNKQG